MLNSSFQVSHAFLYDDTLMMVRLRAMELMALDSWLSLASRSKEITHGKSDLIRTTPARVHWIMEDFKDDFDGIELTAEYGGLQAIKEIAEDLVEDMKADKLSPLEQLYVLVALLRMVKFASCMLSGLNSSSV